MVCRNLYTCIKISESGRNPSCKPISEGFHDQVNTQRPEYVADFAVNITLGIKVTFVQWLQSQITNAFFTGALFAFVAPLFSTMISERIRRAVGHEYDSKLEELRTSNTKVLDELRSARAEREAFRAMAMSLMTSTRAGTLNKRVEAIDVLWRSLQELRTATPHMIGVLDLVGWNISKLGVQGLNDLQNSNYLEALAPNLKSSVEVAKNRPFLGDHLFSMYHAAQAIFGRAISTSILSHQQKHFRHWFKEQDIVDLIKTMLQPEEFVHFYALQSDQLDWLFRSLERRMVAEIQRELSGEPDAEQALLQANRIIERAAALNHVPNERRE